MTMKIIRFSQRGLVGNWRFNEGTGSTAKDSSPFGNNGTIHGASWVRGKFGSALEFDGTDDYAEVPDSNSLHIANAITVASWVKPLDYTDYDNIVSKSGDDTFCLKLVPADNYRYEFGIRRADNNEWWYVQSYVYTFGDWHFVVGTFDGRYIKIYVDGTLQGTSDLGSTVSLVTNTNNLTIGCQFGTGRWFNGTIDEVRIYNRVLSEEEIKIHYAFTKYIKPHPIIMRRKL